VSNVLSEEKKKQVIALGQPGWALRRIEEATGVRRETAAGYLKAAGIPVRPPGGWGRRKVPIPSKPANEAPSDPEASKPANGSEVTTDSGGQKPSPIPTASTSEPYRELIETALSHGRNAMSVWQELVDRHGFTGSYESVKRYVRKLRGTQSPEACGIIETAPGEESQVDYGTGPMVRDAQTGKYRRTRLFVLTLGFSRKCVRLLCFQSSARIWAELHEQAFRRLGGTTRVVIPDNLKEGVLKPDIYDPALNPLYRDVLAHYGSVAMPCRVRDPDRKGIVESGVGHAQKTPLKGQRFESLEAAQSYLDHWEERWADTRIHGTTKRQVSAMFAEEKPSLQPLPLEPFRYYQYGERTVHLDGCIEVEAAYYSAPPGWITRIVQVQSDSLHVRLPDPRTGQLLRELCARRAAAAASKTRTVRNSPLPVSCSCWSGLAGQGQTLASSPKLFTNCRLKPQCDAFRASCLSPKSTASPASTMHAPPLWNYRLTITALCAAIWSVLRSRPSACGKSIP
jgi:transposase